VPQIAPKKHAVLRGAIKRDGDGELWDSWNVAPQKTDLAMVRIARGLAWSWVTSSTLVSHVGGMSRPRGIPFKRVSKTTYPMRRHIQLNDGANYGPTQS
jgi:hypothetical protein